MSTEHADFEVPLLIVSGTVGVGKSAVLDEIHEVFCTANCPDACVDLDALSLSWPMRGAFNLIAVAENLAPPWANYRAAGARRLVIAGVVEQHENIAAYCQAVPGARVSVCQLVASETTRLQRLQRREIGARLDWHTQRTIELQAKLDKRRLVRLRRRQ